MDLKRKESRTLTDDIFIDYLHNEADHQVYNKRQIKRIMKTLKLYFYDQTEDESVKQKYLDYYMEVHPTFAKRYFSSTASEKEKLLIEAIKNAKIAYDDFIAHNFRLVVNTVLRERKKYTTSIDIIDLIQEGSMGLMKATERFDVEKENSFSTYAVWWIRSYVQRYIMKYRNEIYLPQHIMAKVRMFVNAQNELIRKLNKEPTLSEIADYMQISIKSAEKIAAVREVYSNINSLNEPVTYDEETEIGDFVPDNEHFVEQAVLQHLTTNDILQIIENSSLTSTEKDVLMKRYGINFSRVYSLKELASYYHKPLRAIRYIESKAKKKLRAFLTLHGYDIEYDTSSKKEKTKKYYKHM